MIPVGPASLLRVWFIFTLAGTPLANALNSYSLLTFFTYLHFVLRRFSKVITANPICSARMCGRDTCASRISESHSAREVTLHHPYSEQSADVGGAVGDSPCTAALLLSSAAPLLPCCPALLTPLHCCLGVSQQSGSHRSSADASVTCSSVKLLAQLHCLLCTVGRPPLMISQQSDRYQITADC